MYCHLLMSVRDVVTCCISEHMTLDASPKAAPAAHVYHYFNPFMSTSIMLCYVVIMRLCYISALFRF